MWGLHLLALKKSDFKHLDYIHVRCLRRILGVKAAFYSRISNAEVLRRAGAECLEAYIRRKQLALLGHLLRRDQDHPDRLVCFEPNTDLQPRMPAGTRRRRGRPRLTWVLSFYFTMLSGLSRNKQCHNPNPCTKPFPVVSLVRAPM